MFIYKITINGQEYYGLDTKPVYKQHRWKTHKRECMNTNDMGLLHKTMREAGLENCHYEVVEEGFENVHDLAQAEIRYIAEHDTFRNGLNSSLGGDGLGRKDLREYPDHDIESIKKALSDSMSEYNTRIKWANMTEQERKEATAHLHNDEVYQRKSTTLRKYYASNPDARSHRAQVLDEWRKKNRDQLLKQNRRASALGAAKLSKKVKVEFDDGTTKLYSSKSEYAREHGHNLKYILAKTKAGSNHKGRRAWEV